MTPSAVVSRIDSVTVYRSGARITRIADLVAESGGFPAAVRFGGLPLALDDGSVRARVEPIEAAAGAAEAPLAFDLRVAVDVPDQAADLRPADDAALEAARAEVIRIERLSSQLTKELARLERLTLLQRPAGAEGEPPRPTPAEARRALVRVRTGRERALIEEIRAAGVELDAAERRRDQLEDQDRRASGARQTREHELRKAVVVSLRGGVGGARCRLVVEYMVPGACWAPVYTVRLEDGMTAAQLSARAVVAQDTGEDWPMAALTLSTAEAQGWTELPELAGLRIGRAQPSPPRVGWRPPPTGVDDLYGDWDRAFAGRFRGSEMTPVTGYGYALAPPADHDDDFDEVTAVERSSSMPPPPAAPMPVSARPMPPPAPPTIDAMSMMAPQAMRAPSRSPVGGMMKTLAAAVSSVAQSRPEPAKKKAGHPHVLRESAAAPGRARMSTEKVSFDREKSEDDGEPMGEWPDESGGELVAGAELLRYGDLRMAPPSASARGRLAPAARAQLYLELLVEQRVTLRVDVMSAVEGARHRAQQVVGRVPPGCQLAWGDAFDYAYVSEARVDVPSDGDFHSIPLAERAAPTTPLYVVVPRESTDVFRTAVVENPLDAPLLPGPVDVYLRGDFLLTSRVDMTAPRGRFTLGLGVEQAIKVARNTRYREEAAGLMGGSLVLHHHISIEVKNNLPRPAQVEVRERVPVAVEGNDDVEIKLHGVSPRWEEWRQELESPGEAELRGGHRWRVTVPAAGREELRAEYEVKISSKHELVGGNRREA